MYAELNSENENIEQTPWKKMHFYGVEAASTDS